jgi:hypothetical protein
MSDGSFGWRDAKDILKELWSNRKEIAAFVKGIREWFRRPVPAPGILVVGPAGAGKTTLARFLSEDYDLLLDPPGAYQGSLNVEHYTLPDKPKVGIAVLPGQEHRRPATWPALLSNLADGKYRGVILVAAYGHQTIPKRSYKEHELYQNDKARFVTALLEAQRRDELEVLRQLLPTLTLCKNRLWFLTVVAKQDLWWPDRADVERHYTEGEYGSECARALGKIDSGRLRSEIAPASLVISNFNTPGGESLKPNAAGYDQLLQVDSLRRLLETVDALRQWEAGT